MKTKLLLLILMLSIPALALSADLNKLQAILDQLLLKFKPTELDEIRLMHSRFNRDFNLSLEIIMADTNSAFWDIGEILQQIINNISLNTDRMLFKFLDIYLHKILFFQVYYISNYFFCILRDECMIVMQNITHSD